MMRVILPRLGQQSAQALQRALENYEPDPNSDDPSERKLYATLRYTEDALPVALRPLLYPVSLHESYVDADVLTDMAKLAGSPFTEQQTVEMLQLLESAGLAQAVGQNVFRLHPALSRYLRSRSQLFVADTHAGQVWDRAFVQIIAQVAALYAEQPLHNQRGGPDRLRSFHRTCTRHGQHDG